MRATGDGAGPSCSFLDIELAEHSHKIGMVCTLSYPVRNEDAEVSPFESEERDWRYLDAVRKHRPWQSRN